MKIVKTGIAVFCFVFGMNAQQNITPMFPFDGDTITTYNPFFGWFINVMGNGREDYRFVLVELEGNQNAEEGISSNPSVFRQENMKTTQLMYPYDAPKIKENIWYAWQVQKIEAGALTDKSEAWKFILYHPDPIEIKYIKLQTVADATVYSSSNGKFFFQMKENYHTENLDIKVYDDRGQLVLSQAKNDDESGAKQGSYNIKTNGVNLYELNVANLTPDEIYVLYVFDGKGKKHLAKFRVN